MSNSIKHTGAVPEVIYIVSEPSSETFWIYLKEGHAINRMLEERKAGRTACIMTYCQTINK